MSEPQEDRHEGADQEPPPLGSWKRMYVLVLGVLVAEIFLFSVFTWVFK